MRRLKEVSRRQAGMSLYGERRDMYSLVLNAGQALVKNSLDGCHAATDEQLKPIESDLAGLKARRAALEQVQAMK